MGFFQKLKERFTKPKASVSLTIPKSTFGLGENLKGVIVVSSREEFDATEVRAELRCVEKVRKEKIEKKYVVNPRTHRKEWVEETREYWDIATLHSEDPRACGALHLTPRFKKEFPFRLAFRRVGGKLWMAWMQVLLGPSRELWLSKDAPTSLAKQWSFR